MVIVQSIIRDFASKYSNIRTLLRNKNIGVLLNFVDTHDRAAEVYICHVDGDDFLWPRKLQNELTFWSLCLKLQ